MTFIYSQQKKSLTSFGSPVTLIYVERQLIPLASSIESCLIFIDEA
jgi:hypothetical protein